MTACRPVSAEGFLAGSAARPSRSVSSRSAVVIRPLSTPLGEMSMRAAAGSRTLKLPLVAGTQPRAWHQMAVAHKASASVSIEDVSGTIRAPSVATAASASMPANGLYNHLLLTQQQRDRIEVVLVSPRNPLNIGAVARAMANFGLTRLTVVAPYEPHWREAKSAIGAPELLANARETSTLPEAVRDSTFVLGTGTITHRKPEQPVIRLDQLPPVVTRELDNAGTISIIFGPEKHGLTREDLSFCHHLIEIPT